jgi:hypothetical protein
MSIPELEQSLNTLNIVRTFGVILAAIAAVIIAGVTFQYNRKDAQLRNARSEENLRQRESIAHIENDTARALVLLAWRRLNKNQFHIISDGLKEPKIDNLQIAALGGDPEAEAFGMDMVRAANAAGYDIRMGHIFSTAPLFGLSISGPAEQVARLAALFAQAGFPDAARREIGPRNPTGISVGSRPPPRSN